MQFSALRYFLETVRLGSIRQAAEKLHIAPSAISRQIAMLEHQFGMPLFERHSSGVRPTDAGQAFARQARATIRDFERLHSEIDDLQQLRRGTVRIVCVWAAVANLLYPAVAEFLRQYPGIAFDLQVRGGASVVSSLIDEECDLAIGFEPPPHVDVQWIHSLQDPIVAIMRSDHPLAARSSLTLGDLASQPVALPDGSTVTRRLLDQAMVDAGLSFQTQVNFNGIGFGIACVRSTGLLALVPSLVARAEIEAGVLKSAQVECPTLNGTRFVLCRHRTRPRSRPAGGFSQGPAEAF